MNDFNAKLGEIIIKNPDEVKYKKLNPDSNPEYCNPEKGATKNMQKFSPQLSGCTRAVTAMRFPCSIACCGRKVSPPDSTRGKVFPLHPGLRRQCGFHVPLAAAAERSPHYIPGCGGSTVST
jgi:hypothetical protein